MTSTVTTGELKIIEANVNGISNKEPYVKNFLQRRKKKADIFCIVEHKTTQNAKLLEQFASGSYKVGASHCRRTGGPGGGVALLVHEKLTNVQDAENKFRTEFDAVRQKGIEIAAIELRLKPKDCQHGVFVFGIYKRPTVPIVDFINLICELIQKVDGSYNSTAVFTGDFNINNNKEAQKTRSNKYNELLMRVQTLGYRLTHMQPSHAQGSTLNNFLVPKNMKYSQKTLTEGFKIPYKQLTPKRVKEPDHCPIQIIVTLENHRSQPCPMNTQQNQNQSNINFDINAPSTSGTQTKRRLWSEKDGVITIDDSDDDEPTGSQTGIPIASSSDQNQPWSLFHRQTGQDVTVTRVKIEGEPRPSQVNPQTIRLNRPSVVSINLNNMPTIPGPSSVIDHQIPISSGSQVQPQDNPLSSSSSNQQPINVPTGMIERDYPGQSQRNEQHTIHNRHSRPNALVFSTSNGPLQPSLTVQSEINHSNLFRAEESALLFTTESTYREVQTVRPEPSSRPTPYPQVQGTSLRQRDLLRQLDELNRMETLRRRELEVLSQLTEIEQKKYKIMEEMKNN